MRRDADEPKRPYRNVETFRLAYGGLKLAPGVWPCLTCRGRGKVNVGYNNTYEMRPEYEPCPACEKCPGVGTRKACIEAYSEAIREWVRQVEAYKAHRALVKSALAKLTPEEKQALNIYE